jgi:RNA polymerase sigma factor (sigma-70 family)
MSNLFTVARNVSPLPRTQQTALAVLAQNGDRSASDQLVQCNMRLAIKIARKHQRNGIELEDLIATAAGATLDAIRVFDSSKGANFPTVARQWMIARCQEVVQGNSCVSGDSRATRKLFRKGPQVARELQANGDLVNPSTVAASLGLPVASVREAWSIVFPSAASLSAPVGDTGSTFGDLLPSRQIPQDEAMDRTRAGERVVSALSAFVDTLSLRDRHIFRSRNLAEYLGNDPMPQADLAEANGISKPRVCQIEKALNKKCAEFLKSQGFAA